MGSVRGSSATAVATDRAPVLAGPSQSMPASCQAAADCCQTETGCPGTGGLEAGRAVAAGAGTGAACDGPPSGPATGSAIQSPSSSNDRSGT